MPAIIMSPHIVIMGMPMPIMFIIFMQASANIFASMPAFGVISQRMAPVGIISQDISHIIIGIIMGIPPIMPFIGMPPIGIMPFIMGMPPIIPFIMGIMPFIGIPPIIGIMPFIIGIIMGIMFIGMLFIIGIWAAVIIGVLLVSGVSTPSGIVFSTASGLSPFVEKSLRPSFSARNRPGEAPITFVQRHGRISGERGRLSGISGNSSNILDGNHGLDRSRHNNICYV